MVFISEFFQSAEIGATSAYCVFQRLQISSLIFFHWRDHARTNVIPGSICVHGDTPTAVSILQKIREGLRKASIAVKPMGE